MFATLINLWVLCKNGVNMSCTPIKNVVHLVTRSCGRPSSIKIPTSQKVSRCLFSKERVVGKRKLKEVCTLDGTHLGKDTLPLFDTPQRKNIPSIDEVRKTFTGCVLGRGSFGTVVKGIYKRKEVAVKMIYYDKKKSVYNTFKKEENALALTHTNIIQVLKITTLPEMNIGCVFMEYYPHRTLEQVLIDIIPLHIKLKYLSEITSALEYCHNKSVLHLDVKPNNVLVGLLNDVSKLCDFGSSKRLDNFTASGSSPKGTLKYCAPEMLTGKIISAKADVYSFGVTMWQVLHQESPYQEEDVHVVVYKVVKQNYRPRKIKSQTGLINSRLENIYKSCWDEEPANRPSMSAIYSILGEIKLSLVV